MFPFLVKKLRGFTLIEVLVSISVAAVLSGIGLAAYAQFNRRQILSSAVRMVISDLRLAQSKADGGEKPEECSGGLLGYKFVMEGDTGYSLQADCSPAVVLIKTVSFQPAIKKIAGFNYVKFKSLRQGVEINPSVNNFITIQAFGSEDLQKTIRIGLGGEIYVE